MSESNLSPLPPAAAEAKASGNDHFRKKEWAAAMTKYSEAISLAPKNAVLYSNRSACLIKMEKSNQALSDAKRCLKLDPKWSKGYLRLSAAYESLKQLNMAIQVLEKGKEILPADCSDPLKKDFTNNLIRLTRLKDSKTLIKNKTKMVKAEDTPPAKFKKLIQEGKQFSLYSAAFKLTTQWESISSLYETLYEARVVENGVSSQAGLIANFVAHALNDHRAFHVKTPPPSAGPHNGVRSRLPDGRMDFSPTTLFNNQMLYEQMVRGSVGPNRTAEETIGVYKKRLPTEGWDKIRPALTLTIRSTILTAIMTEAFFQGKAGEAAASYRKALAIITLARNEWPDLDTQTLGNSMEPTFSRLVRLRLMRSLMSGWANSTTEKERDTFSMEEIKQLAEETIADCRERSLSTLAAPGDFLMFEAYPLADSHAALGFYYSKLSESEKEGARWKGNEFFRDSKHLDNGARHYAIASTYLPDDEPEKVQYLYASLDLAIRKGGLTVKDLLSLSDRAESFREQAIDFWGEETMEYLSRDLVREMVEKVRKGLESGADAGVYSQVTKSDKDGSGLKPSIRSDNVTSESGRQGPLSLDTVLKPLSDVVQAKEGGTDAASEILKEMDEQEVVEKFSLLRLYRMEEEKRMGQPDADRLEQDEDEDDVLSN